MAYEFHIRRTDTISLAEWKDAVRGIGNLTLDTSSVSVTNRSTGEKITIEGAEGDVAINIGKDWIKVFRFSNSAGHFNARGVALDDPNHPVLLAAFALATRLGARVVGDDGEELTMTTTKR